MTTLGVAGVVGASTPTAAQSLSRTFSIESNGGRFSYTLAVSGELEKGNTADPNDTITGSTATGQGGGGGVDGYEFTGELVVLQITGDATAYLNGEHIDPDDYFDSVVTIEGSGSRTEYTLASSGVLAYTGANGASIDSNDERWGSTAIGQVDGERDSYKFTGELVALDLDGDATVYLNGERIDSDEYLDTVLTIEGGSSRAEYTVSTSDTLKYTGANGATIDSGDNRWGSTATGQVESERDSYKFSGELVVLGLDESATAYLNGERIDPDDYFDNVITIEGGNSRAEYTVASSETLAYTGANGASIDSNDDRWGSTAIGQVDGERDSYKFTGELVVLDLDEGATAHVNGERINPDEYPDNVVTIEGADSRAEYTLETSGTLSYTGANGATIDSNDDRRGSTATGQVESERDSYKFSGEITDIRIDGEATVYLNGEQIDPSEYDSSESPMVGVHSGLSDADFETIRRIEDWQDAPYAVQTLFVPWNPDSGHMDWLFERVLPKIWDAGRVPLITWEPFTPGAQTAAVDTQSLVERGEYDAYLESLADTTPDDIEVRIADGEYDGYIKRWAGRLREWLAGPDGRVGTDDDRRAYLRLAHEMNGDWYPWSPTVGGSSASSYVDMWRYVHRQFTYAGIADAVEWMWCVNADDVGAYSAEQLYPGDGYIDWLAVDGYQWGESQDWSRWESPESIFGNMLGRVRALADKPVCIAETASTSVTRSGNDPARKDEWIRNAFEYFDNEGVELWCWFNEDKETDWAMFDGVRGTERVTYDGERINAYAAYRESIDTHAATANALEAKPMTTAAFTGER